MTLTSTIYYNSLKNSTKYGENKSLKFDVAFFTDGTVNQVLRYFNRTLEYTLDEISENSKDILKKLFK